MRVIFFPAVSIKWLKMQTKTPTAKVSLCSWTASRLSLHRQVSWFFHTPHSWTRGHGWSSYHGSTGAIGWLTPAWHMTSATCHLSPIDRCLPPSEDHSSASQILQYSTTIIKHSLQLHYGVSKHLQQESRAIFSPVLCTRTHTRTWHRVNLKY